LERLATIRFERLSAMMPVRMLLELAR